MYGLALRGREIPSIFEDFFSDNWYSNFQRPAYMEWDEDGNKGTITVEAPGFSKDDIKVESTSKGITITGEITDESVKNRLTQSKFSYILRRSDLSGKIDAKLENGILTIGVEKAKDKKSKVIEIQ